MSPMSLDHAGEDQVLRDRANACSRLAKDFDDWIARFSKSREGTPERLPPDLASQVRRHRRQINNLKTATSVPVALAVYGASQSGKSLTLGRLLATRSGQRSSLGYSRSTPAFGSLDFLKHLNPRREVESTAVVTRFSHESRISSDVVDFDYPVIARFLSRSDLLTAMAKGFMGECEPEIRKVWDVAEVERLLRDEISPKYKADVVDTDWRMDICDSVRLMNLEYRDYSMNITEDAVAELLGRYPLKDDGYRMFCAHVFWHDWSELTSLFGRLISLRSIIPDDVDIAHLSWDSLPYILDSSRPEHTTRSDVFGSTHWGEFRLCVSDSKVKVGRLNEGKSVGLEVLQGILAEVQIPVIGDDLTPAARQLFEQADVLDIPGARTSAGRAKVTFSEFSQRVNDGIHIHVLKRGRIGLLFEKYAQEQQIASVLYLQKWGLQETRSEIGPQIKAWGRARYGDAWPAGLSVADVASPGMFVAFTQIDRIPFGEPPRSGVFDEVIKQELVAHFPSFINNFGADGRCFTNVFLLRNPGVRVGDDQQNPFGARADEWAREFAESPMVKKYFADLSDKWSQAFSPDGGLSLLVNRILPCLGRQARIKWLDEKLLEEEGFLKASIRGLHVDTAPQAEARRMESVVNSVLQWLGSDYTGRRAKALRDALWCDPAFIDGALHDQRCEVDGNDEGGVSLVPIRTDFERITCSILERWVSSRRPLQGLDAETFYRLTGYISRYVAMKEGGGIAAALQDLDRSIGKVHKAYRFRRLASMIINDALITPGPREIRKACLFREDEYASIRVLHERYSRILGERLKSVLDARALTPPPGNDELRQLTDSL
jgi:hypothetical protein